MARKADARADRLHLLNHNRDMLMLGVSTARTDGAWHEHHVACIVDLDDRVGRDLVVATGGDLAGEPFRKRGTCIPTSLLVMEAPTSRTSSRRTSRRSPARSSTHRFLDTFGSS